jgi:predicted RNase H-like HicB family nuclease
VDQVQRSLGTCRLVNRLKGVPPGTLDQMYPDRGGVQLSVSRVFNVIIERDSEGYYVATVPDLRGCHTQATSLDTLMERAREAIELCLEVEGE